MVLLIDDLIFGIAGWLFTKLGIAGASCAYKAGAAGAITAGSVKAHSAIGLSLTQHGLGLGVELLGTGKSGISISLGTQGLEAGLRITDNFSLGISTGLFESGLFKTTKPYVDDLVEKLEDKSRICPDCYETYYSFHVCSEKWKPQRQSISIDLPKYDSSVLASNYYVDDLVERLRTETCARCGSIYLRSAGHNYCRYSDPLTVTSKNFGVSAHISSPRPRLYTASATKCFSCDDYLSYDEVHCYSCGQHHARNLIHCYACGGHYEASLIHCYACGEHYTSDLVHCYSCNGHFKPDLIHCYACGEHHPASLSHCYLCGEHHSKSYNCRGY